MAELRTQGLVRPDIGRLNAVANAKAYMAMRDVKWQDHLHSADHEAIMKAYHTEWDALKSSILVELEPTHPEYGEALRRATGGRCILEFKRTGVWKVRVVVRGYEEDKVYLDGEGFDYAANVCEISAVRNLLFEPRESPYTGKTDGPADGNNDNGDNTRQQRPNRHRASRCAYGLPTIWQVRA